MTNSKIVRCEISDLYIIYSSDSETRHTFLQNKYTRQLLGNYLRAVSSQWFLLSHRPTFSSASTRFPNDVLSSAFLHSVGSYGVFYKSTTSIDMDYTAADLLQAAKNAGIVSSLNYFNLTNTGTSGKVRSFGNRKEIERANNLNLFDLAGRAMLIGTPICENDKSWPYVKRIVAGVIKERLLKQADLSYDSISKLKKRFGIDEQQIENATSPHFSVAIINDDVHFLFKCQNAHSIQKLSNLLGSKFQEVTNMNPSLCTKQFMGIDLSQQNSPNRPLLHLANTVVVDEKETASIVDSISNY